MQHRRLKIALYLKGVGEHAPLGQPQLICLTGDGIFRLGITDNPLWLLPRQRFSP
jgi:hypothetical protein